MDGFQEKKNRTGSLTLVWSDKNYTQGQEICEVLKVLRNFSDLKSLHTVSQLYLPSEASGRDLI